MKKAVDIYLIRHGQTEWNSEGRLQGQQDSSLSSAGELQARSVGLRLSRLAVRRVVCSDLGRTRATAAHVIDALHIGQAEAATDWRERHLGVLQGRRVSQLCPEHAEVHRLCRTGPPDYRPEGGESRVEVQRRGLSALRELAHGAKPGEGICIVSHGGILGVVLSGLLGVPLSAPKRFSVSNCSFNHLRFASDEFEIATLGDTHHLRKGG